MLKEKKKPYIFLFKGTCTTTAKVVGDSQAWFDNTSILVMP
jgi:hypothetical protein